MNMVDQGLDGQPWSDSIVVTMARFDGQLWSITMVDHVTLNGTLTMVKVMVMTMVDIMTMVNCG